MQFFEQRKMSVTVCRSHATEESKMALDRVVANMNNGSAVAVDPDTILGVPIQYVVIPFGSTVALGNISDASIAAQHQVLLDNFSLYQGTFKNVTHYNFEDLFGNPRISFFPLDVTQISQHIQRLSVPTAPPAGGYSSFDDVQAEYTLQGGVQTAGTINVYITTLANGSGGQLLGEAGGIPSNALTVHFGTIGSSTVPGSFATSDFGAGTTLIHELGHCLGLYHPFETGTTSCTTASTCCAAAVPYHDAFNPQSALQYNPNYGGQVFLANLTTGSNAWDNRGRDLLLEQSPGCSAATPPSTTCGLKATGNPTPTYGCTAYQGQSLTDASTEYESFVLFMDYASDSSRIGFFSYTTELMRSVLMNHPNLFSVTVLPNASVSPVTPTTSSGGLSTGAIVGIAIGATVGVVVLALIIAYGRKGK